MKPPPIWAQNLLLSALLYWEAQHGQVPVPALEWRRGAKSSSSGRTAPRLDNRDKGRIVITAGSDRADAKLVLLHEIGHWLTPMDHHSDRFWDVAWELYRWAKLPVRYCLWREGNYRTGAVAAYHRGLGRKKPEVAA